MIDSSSYTAIPFGVHVISVNAHRKASRGWRREQNHNFILMRYDEVWLGGVFALNLIFPFPGSSFCLSTYQNDCLSQSSLIKVWNMSVIYISIVGKGKFSCFPSRFFCQSNNLIEVRWINRRKTSLNTCLHPVYMGGTQKTE